MSEFTKNDLKEIMYQCGGGDLEEGQEFNVDDTYEELGYDSLAVLEIGSIIKTKLGLSFEIPVDVETPRETIEYVTERMK